MTDVPASDLPLGTLPTEDTLANVTGRAWLAEHLDEIAFKRCPELLELYREFRGGDTGDRHAFVDAVEALAHDAAQTAAFVLDGACDVRDVISVLALMAHLDHAIHRPHLKYGWSRFRARRKHNEFATQTAEHERWAEALDQEIRALQAQGGRRVRGKAAENVVEKLKLDVKPKYLLEAVLNLSRPPRKRTPQK